MVVRLKDIAAQAGVSTTTVSRILNGRDSGIPIREETRQKVIALAAKMGYRPNILARALRGSHSTLLGVIAVNITSLFHTQILRGINDTAIRRSYRVFLGHVQRDMDIALDYSSMFEQSHADGILIVGELQGHIEAIDVLMQHHRYLVGVSDRMSRSTYPGVYTDNVLGARLALDHLWSLGHRRIMCVNDSSLQDGRLRCETYERYMRERGAAAQIQVVETPRSLQASLQAGTAIFAAKELPTAIFAVNDAIAIGLMQAAFQAEIPVPSKVSIVGFDDIDIAPFTIPPLTTIRQSGFELGAVATTLLIDMIQAGRESADVEDIVLTPTLVERQSTAPLRGRSRKHV
ncbi:MAG: LacI family DNA-binding transcriptional regulator [Anaerolineae bacterium]|nr:LacI family DNA-binding transcriptional regulator [Anaerolineae bacterium]